MLRYFFSPLRSSPFVLAYLMHEKHSTLDEAFEFLREQNGAIAPNFHFMGQLHEFERVLASENLMTPDSGFNSAGSSVPSSTTSSESGLTSY